MEMTRKQVVDELTALRESFADEYNAIPICLDEAIRMLEDYKEFLDKKILRGAKITGISEHERHGYKFIKSSKNEFASNRIDIHLTEIYISAERRKIDEPTD